MAQRVTLRKRTPYNTTSARRRVVKTPGGKLVVHHLKKLAVSTHPVSPSFEQSVLHRERRETDACRTDENRTDPSVVTVDSDFPVSPLSGLGSTPPSPRGRRPSSGLTADRGVPGVSRTGEPGLSSVESRGERNETDVFRHVFRRSRS